MGSGFSEFVQLLTLAGILVLASAVLTKGLKWKGVNIDKAHWIFSAIFGFLVLAIIVAAGYGKRLEYQSLTSPGQAIAGYVRYNYDPGTNKFIHTEIDPPFDAEGKVDIKTTWTHRNPAAPILDGVETRTMYRFKHPFAKSPTVIASIAELPANPTRWNVRCTNFSRDGFDVVFTQWATPGQPVLV